MTEILIGLLWVLTVWAGVLGFIGATIYLTHGYYVLALISFIASFGVAICGALMMRECWDCVSECRFLLTKPGKK